MEAGEDGSELIGQLAALMEQLTEGGGLEGIPQELVEAPVSYTHLTLPTICSV